MILLRISLSFSYLFFCYKIVEKRYGTHNELTKCLTGFLLVVVGCWLLKHMEVFEVGLQKNKNNILYLILSGITVNYALIMRGDGPNR